MKSKLKNSIILITGGLGNIGSFIIDELLGNHDPKLIVVVDNNFNGNINNLSKWLNDERLIIQNLDISNYHDVYYVFKEYNFDYVFHQASMLINDSEILPHKAFNTNIIGTLNIIQLCNEFNIKKISYASSASVFGEPKYLPVDENHPYQYKNFVYGITKITNEMMFLSMCKVPWNGFRYYNVYSERTNKGTYYTQVIRIIINKILKNEPIVIFGNGNQTMDLIYCSDIAAINIAAINSDINGHFFNVGTNEQTSLNELIEIIKKYCSKKFDVTYNSNYDPQKVSKRQCDYSKAKEILSWEPKVKLENGIKIVLRHYNLLKEKYE